MTPKEKASNLVNEFRMILMDEDTDCGNEILCTLIGIKCANVTVDQIMTYDNSKLSFIYWEEVKKELSEL